MIISVVWLARSQIPKDPGGDPKETPIVSLIDIFPCQYDYLVVVCALVVSSC